VLAGDFDRNCLVTAFDTQLVAGFYGADNASRNVTGDATIDLADVNAVAARQGASCLADKPTPGSGNGNALLALTTTTHQLMVGEMLKVNLTVADLRAAALGGVGVHLHFDPNRLGVVKVRWNPALGHLLSLGPTVQDSLGMVAFGAMDLPTNLPLNTPLATVTLIGRSVGKTQLSVTSAEALNGSGQLITATAAGQSTVQVNGTTLFLSAVHR
jgi:hypothetical protein